MSLSAFAPTSLSWRKHGTKDFAHWLPGEPIRSTAELKPGDVLFHDSAQFDALNLVIVIKASTAVPGAMQLRFVNPHDTTRVRPGASPGGFTLHDSDAFLVNADGTPVLRRATCTRRALAPID